MGEETWKWLGALGAVVVFGWGMIRWAIGQHSAMRKELNNKIEDANTAMNNRLLELSRTVQTTNDHQRDRMDECAKGLRLEIAQKADKASFERATDRLFELMDEQRTQVLAILSDFRKSDR